MRAPPAGSNPPPCNIALPTDGILTPANGASPSQRQVCRLAIESQTLSALLALFARLEQEAPGTVGWRAVAGVLTQALHEVEKQTAEAADELRAASLDKMTLAVPAKGIPREQSLPYVLSTGAMAEGSPAPPSQSVPPAVADEADDMDLESSSTEGGEDGEVPPLPPGVREVEEGMHLGNKGLNLHVKAGQGTHKTGQQYF